MNEFASPKSEFGYDDAYSLGDEFVEGMYKILITYYVKSSY